MTDTIVTPNQKSYPYYHQRFRRVPTIDQCYVDDVCCYFEANQQWKRDRAVDENILNILRSRFEDCMLYEAPDEVKRCQHIWDAYKEAEANWFSKCMFLVALNSCALLIDVLIYIVFNCQDGDLGYYGDVRDSYMKQKHRMIWERRHGKIGSGRKDKEEETGH